MMFAWYWLVFAAVVGAVIGTLAASLCAVAKREDED